VYGDGGNHHDAPVDLSHERETVELGKVIGPTSAGSEATLHDSGTAEHARVGRHLATHHPERNLWSSLGREPLTAVFVGLVLASVFGILGVVGSLGQTTTYTSTTVMLIDDPYQLATSGDQQWFVKLDALRTKYSGLVGTDLIAGPVAEHLHLPVNAVIGAVSTQVPFASLLMSVTATWQSPREAQLISQSVANEVTNYVMQEDVTNNIPSSDRFSFATIDPASAPVPQTPSKSRAITFAMGLAVLGFAVGFFATQLARYLR
jgi:capsular polysaccharide biosynthesis protein